MITTRKYPTSEVRARAGGTASLCQVICTKFGLHSSTNLILRWNYGQVAIVQGSKPFSITFVINQRQSQATVKNPLYQGLCNALTCYQYHKFSILDFRFFAIPSATPDICDVAAHWPPWFTKRTKARHALLPICLWPISSAVGRYLCFPSV